MSHNTDVELSSTEINTPTTEDVVSSNSHEICAEVPQEILSVKKEYSIVGDLFYAGTNSDSAPTWLTDLITSQVNVSVDNGLVDYDLLVQDVRSAIDSIDIASNTYVEQINFTANVDTIVGTHLATLNVTNDNKYATIVNLDIVEASSTSALALSTTDLRAEFTADINSRATTIETAFAAEDQALANSINALTTAFTDQETGLSGTADAVSGLQTYVGLTGESLPNGTGMLGRLGLVEKQTDGIIDYITDTYDVMSGIENPNTNTNNDLLLVDALPYVLWVGMVGSGVPVSTTRDYMDYSLIIPAIAQVAILDNTLYERTDFTDVDVDKYYKYTANAWVAITTADYLLNKNSLRSAHTADVYIYYSTNASGIRSYIKSYKFIKTIPDSTSPYATDTEGYGWSLIVDTDAQSTYMAILNTRAAADGKISQFYAWGGPTQPTDYTIITRPVEYSTNASGDYLDINGFITTNPGAYVILEAEQSSTVSADDFFYWFHDDGDLYRKGAVGWNDEETVPLTSGNGTYISEGDVLTVFDTSLVDGEPRNELVIYSFNGVSWQIAGPDGIISKNRFFVDLDNAVTGPAGVAKAISNLEITSAAYTDQETTLVENRFAYDSTLIIGGEVYTSGFGMQSVGATTGTDAGTGLPTFDSVFRVNAEKFILTSPSFPSVEAKFNITASGLLLSLDQTEATRNTPKGPHILTNSYSKGDMVTSGGSSYIALIDVPANTLITSNTHWEVMALGGVSARGPGIDAVPAYSNGDYASITYDETEGALVLQSDTDVSIGMAYPAFNVESGSTVEFSVSYKSSSASGSGLYVRVYEYDSDLPTGKLAVSLQATNPVVQETTRQAVTVPSASNLPVTTSYQTTSFSYTPTGTAKWASIVILNWTGMGSTPLHIKPISIKVSGARGTAVLTYSHASVNGTTAAEVSNIPGYWNAAASTNYEVEIEGDTLILTNPSTVDGWTHIYEYVGGAWTAANTFTVNGNQVVTGTILGNALVAQAVIRSPKIEYVGTTHTRVSAADGFGSSNQFIEWFGVNQLTGGNVDYALLTEANAITYLKTDGSAYFGGAILSGTLSNALTSSSLSATADVDVGVFGSNGGAIAIVASVTINGSFFTDTGTVSPATPSSITTTITLEEYIVSSWVTRQTASYVGTSYITDHTGGGVPYFDSESGFYNYTLNQSLSGSFTYTDNQLTTNDRHYRVRMTARANVQTVGWTRSQRIGIVTSEG